MRPRQLAVNLSAGIVLIAVYFLIAQAGLMLQVQYGNVTPLWPSAGLALALLWLGGWRWFPVIVIGECLMAYSLNQPVSQGVVGGGAQLLEAGLGLWLLRREQIQQLFESIFETFYYSVIICLVPPVAGATLGTLGLWWHGLLEPSTWRLAWFTWWLGDAMALLIITPFIIVWSSWPLKGIRQTAGLALILGLLLASGIALVYSTGARGNYLFFILLPFMAWAAVRYRAAGATSAALLLTVLVLGMDGTANGDFLAAVRVGFIGACAYMGYLLAAGYAEQRRLFKRLRYQASHDPVTGLYNRDAFDRRLLSLTQGESGREHTLIYLDLDHFKLVNDTCGHQAGDRLLRSLGHTLTEALPKEALLARLGGDEFGVLIPRTAHAEAEAHAEQLRRAIVNFTYQVDAYQFRLGASMGMTFFSDDEPPSAILSRGDIACYNAKEEGGNRVRIYNRRDLAMRKQQSEMQWVSQFHAAMQAGKLQLYGQRIVPLRGDPGGVETIEVLLRLWDEKENPVSAKAFMPIAGRYGLLPSIDHWVVSRSFEFLQLNAHAPLRLSVNLSATSLDRPNFLGEITELVDEFNVQPDRIWFEVTERIAIQHMNQALAAIRKLSDRGFRFALDDFGSGVASFGYLQQLPVHLVKIDGQFIHDLEDNPASRIVVEALQKLARHWNMKCVAEWVESEPCLEALREIQMDFAQGYHLHRPQPLIEMVEPVKAPVEL